MPKIGHYRQELRGSVAGRVVDASGNPLEGARVFAQRKGWHAEAQAFGRVSGWHSAEAGEDGRFVLDDIPAAPDTSLWFDHPRGARTRLEDLCVYPNRCVDLGDVSMPAPFARRIRVIDDAGLAVVGAELWIEPYYYQAARSLSANGPGVGGKTDQEGCYVFNGFPPGSQSLVVRADGHRSEHAFLDFGVGDQEEVELVLHRCPLVFAGQVSSRDGKTLAGARVWLNEDEASSTTTDVDGGFRFESWHAGDRLVFASLEGYVTSGVSADPGEPIEISLDPAYWLEFECVDAVDSSPLELDEVSLCEVVHDAEGRDRFFSG